MQGYLHPLYAQSFTNIGEPVFLPRSKGWLIKRRIPGTELFDAMGPYPLFFCDDFEGLIADIEDLRDSFISISMVIGPFSKIPLENFNNYFDIFKEYKNHYLLDLSLPLKKTISKNKRKNSRRALRDLDVQFKIAPNIDLDEWVNLYDCLIERHKITGIRKFSRESFAKQISIPNTHYFRVLHKGKIVGGNLFYIQGNVAYAHLSAFTDDGYDLGAAYAVKYIALNHLKNEVKCVNFGGGSGKSDGETDGLDLFKQGWSNRNEPSYFAGKIMKPAIYKRITDENGMSDNHWFPAYRSNDF